MLCKEEGNQNRHKTGCKTNCKPNALDIVPLTGCFGGFSNFIVAKHPPFCHLRIAFLSISHRIFVPLFNNYNKQNMKSLEIVSLKVSDQNKSKEFYMKLGFKIIMESPMGNGQTWVQMGLPGQEISISLMDFQALIIETEDIEKEIRNLKTKGIEAQKIDDTPWGKFSQLKDPDGNSLTLHQK